MWILKKVLMHSGGGDTFVSRGFNAPYASVLTLHESGLF